MLIDGRPCGCCCGKRWIGRERTIAAIIGIRFGFRDEEGGQNDGDGRANDSPCLCPVAFSPAPDQAAFRTRGSVTKKRMFASCALGGAEALRGILMRDSWQSCPALRRVTAGSRKVAGRVIRLGKSVIRCHGVLRVVAKQRLCQFQPLRKTRFP